jgi:hypothetical protein
MISFKHALLSIALGLGVSAQAHATNISLIADGQWSEFVVSEFDAISGGTEWIDGANTLDPNFGTALTYQFTIQNGFVGQLTVVDSSFSGDVFDVKSNGLSIGQTSTATEGASGVYNFDDNLADSRYSRGIFTLTAGNYNITGSLFSTTQPFYSTNGALKLEVAAVPEESTFAMLLAGLGLMAFARRRA